jgi:uncharacterized protein (TIGR03083 family)
MSTTLELAGHLAAISRSAARLSDAGRSAGLRTRVPTCPAWNVRQLVTHQGTVHRWAAANLSGDQAHRTGTSSQEAAAAPDLFDWFEAGARSLREVIASAAEDVVAPVFLLDAPSPRRFWARRQAHETTIHAADALAAQLGRPPTAAEVDVSVALAADGIDELLCGFITRRKSRLRSVDPYVIGVRVTETDRTWRVAVSEAPPVTTLGPGAYDAELSGTAAELYLGLWNRGNELRLDGPPGVLDQWRSLVRVSWT